MPIVYRTDLPFCGNTTDYRTPTIQLENTLLIATWKWTSTVKWSSVRHPMSSVDGKFCSNIVVVRSIIYMSVK